ASGIAAGATGGGQAQWPYLGHQGAGAFLALTLVGLYLSRGYLAEVWRIAFGGVRSSDPSTLNPQPSTQDSAEPMPYRLAFLGLAACMAAMVAWCMAAGMRGVVAAALIVLALLYMIAAARVRAETGNAWLFGPAGGASHVT